MSRYRMLGRIMLELSGIFIHFVSVVYFLNIDTGGPDTTKRFFVVEDNLAIAKIHDCLK